MARLIAGAEFCVDSEPAATPTSPLRNSIARVPALFFRRSLLNGSTLATFPYEILG
jgi:hypothetical protein